MKSIALGGKKELRHLGEVSPLLTAKVWEQSINLNNQAGSKIAHTLGGDWSPKFKHGASI